MAINRLPARWPQYSATRLGDRTIATLKEGATYEDFRRAWLPEEGFGVPVRVLSAVRRDDPRELLSVGLVDLPAGQLDAALARVAEQEARRHERIAAVIESTTLAGIYELRDDDNLS